MDWSFKILLGIAAVVGVLYARIKASIWFEAQTGRFQILFFVIPVAALSLNSTLQATEPFWLGHIIGWSLLWGGLMLLAFTGAPPSDTQAEPQREGGSTELVRQEIVTPRITFDDVVGMHDLKDSLLGSVDAIISGKRNGILFYSAPGNGKTMMAEALAGSLADAYKKESRVVFMPVSMASIASRWTNQSTEQLRDLFSQAAVAAEGQGICVLFIDEIDSVLVARETISRGDSEVSQQVNTMLTLLNDYRDFTKHGIIILGATNHLDKLDSAAIREGRFDFKVAIPPPDFDARVHLLTAFLPKSMSYADGVVDRLARRWEGFSVVRIRTVAEKATELAQASKTLTISFECATAALRLVQGSLGERLPENTMTLGEMTFPPKMRSQLESLANRMIRIDEIEEAGGTVPRGVLFYGPPGTGKTAAAKGLAKTATWAFLSTSGQELMADASAIERFLEKASDIRPCVVFIDEADDILQDRGSNPATKAATNRLLQAIDGTMPLHDVVLIAATNHPDILDGAAVRGGRFSERIEFALPGEAEITKLVADFRAQSRANFAVDWCDNIAAKLLVGLAPADVRDRLQKAVNYAVGRPSEQRMVTIGDLELVVV